MILGKLLVVLSLVLAPTFALAETNLSGLLRKHPRGVGIILIVQHPQKPPDQYFERATGLLKRYRPQLLCAAVVIESQGFAAAAQRSLGAMILTAAGMQQRNAIFAKLDLACGWLAERLFLAEEVNQGERALHTALSELKSHKPEYSLPRA